MMSEKEVREEIKRIESCLGWISREDKMRDTMYYLSALYNVLKEPDNHASKYINELVSRRLAK